MFDQSVITRFWAKIKLPDRVGTDECWPWIGGKISPGYGSFRALPELHMLAHRMAYLLTKGSIPNGYHVCHTCDNPPCCNPAHLWLGTDADNLRDMRKKGRAVISHKSRNAGNNNGMRLHPERVPRGEQQGGSKLNSESVIKIRNLYEADFTMRELSNLFNVSPSCIQAIIDRRNWKHIP